MLLQYVRWWTLGWNQEGKIINLPILARKTVVYKEGDPLQFQFIEDKPDFVAKDRNAMLVLFDTEQFALDDYGNRDFGDWHIVNQIAKICDPSAISKAIQALEDAHNSPTGLLPGLQL
jgi:hypothetical protein